MMTRAQRRYQRCIIAGKCYSCGQPAPMKRRCAICLRKQVVAQARRLARIREERLEDMRRLRHAG
jgi:hypothetical protein